MQPQVLYVLAFVCFVAAALYSLTQRAWVWVLLLAGLACWIAPAAFQLTS